MADELHACDKCLRPMGEKEVCWRRDIVDGKPVMAPMCEDCWDAFVWDSPPTVDCDAT